MKAIRFYHDRTLNFSSPSNVACTIFFVEARISKMKAVEQIVFCPLERGGFPECAVDVYGC